MLNLDTHILVALLSGDLSTAELELLTSHPLAISDMVLWELAKLVELGRLNFDFDDAHFGAFLHSCTIFPMTLIQAGSISALIVFPPSSTPCYRRM
jgi:hypothetical protein